MIDIAGGVCNCLYDSNTDTVNKAATILVESLSLTIVWDPTAVNALMSVVCKLFHGKGDEISAKATQCARLLIKVLFMYGIAVYINVCNVMSSGSIVQTMQFQWS